MNLNQLRYFIEVCNCSNITKAAMNLHISQPSLTVAIKNLERDLGVNLFYRAKQRISLTTEGKFFLDKLQPIMSNLDKLITEMVSIGENNNVLKIGIPPMQGSFMFPQIFANFISSNPDIKLEIVEYGALKVQQLLLEEELDLTLLIEESQLNKEIDFKPISKRDFKFYVNPNHKLAKKDTIKFLDLKDEPLILFNKEFYVSRVVKDSFKAHSIEPNIVLETTQINTINRFIKEGLASSILIDGCITEKEDFISIPIENIEPITIGIARKKNRFINSSSKKMIKFINNQYI